MPNRLTTAIDNITALTASVWNNEIDNIYGGTILRSGGSWGSANDVKTIYGSANNTFIHFNTPQTVDALTIGVDATSQTLLVLTSGTEGTNFSHVGRTVPTIIIQGSTIGTYSEYAPHAFAYH